MNTVATIELKRYGWRQKIVKNSFVIFGKPPYVELIKPKKLWKQALPNRKRRCFVGEGLFLQTRSMRTSRGSTLVEPEFDVFLLEAIDEALSALGDSIMQTVYFHVERSFHIKKHEIPYRLGAFTKAVENIFGVGANFIEILIMKKLHKKVDAHFMWNESEGFGLAEYVSEAKRVFQERNMIKTVEELVECEETVAEI